MFSLFLALILAAIALGAIALVDGRPRNVRRRSLAYAWFGFVAVLAALSLPQFAHAQHVHVHIGGGYRHQVVTPFVPSSIVQVPIAQVVAAPVYAPQAVIPAAAAGATPSCCSSTPAVAAPVPAQALAAPSYAPQVLQTIAATFAAFAPAYPVHMAAVHHVFAIQRAAVIRRPPAVRVVIRRR